MAYLGQAPSAAARVPQTAKPLLAGLLHCEPLQESQITHLDGTDNTSGQNITHLLLELLRAARLCRPGPTLRGEADDSESGMGRLGDFLM